jgi:hypothetical protein
LTDACIDAGEKAAVFPGLYIFSAAYERNHPLAVNVLSLRKHLTGE